MKYYSEGYEEMFKPQKPKINPNIWCYKCKNESGWTNNDLLLLRGEYTLNCKRCGRACIKGLSNNRETYQWAKPRMSSI